MYAARFEFGIFGRQGDAVDEALSFRAIVLGCDYLFNVNCDYLEAYRNVPWLYQSGIYYESPALDCGDVWSDIPMLIARRYGDCKSLACMLAAQLWVYAGISATPFVRRKWLDDGTSLYHVVVRMPDGAIEDPSWKLGMPLSQAA